MSHRLLIAEDDADMGAMLARLARQAGLEPQVATDGAEAEVLLDAVDALATDLRPPVMAGKTLLKRARERHPPMPVVMITGYATTEDAIEAFRVGVRDILTKPFDADEVRARFRHIACLLRGDPATEGGGSEGAAVGDADPQTPGLRDVFTLLGEVAPLDVPVLLTGETGTGKGVTARWIHEHSPRRDGPFEALNCASIAENLVESELFGHEKGAFTGAGSRRPGLLELAAGGTLLIDEINSAPPSVQAGLLDFLQHRRIRRVGGQEGITVDTRLVVAGNEPLEELVARREFRADLYYRLHVFPVTIPPLRQRPEDIRPLAEGFLARSARELGRTLEGFEPPVLEWLEGRSWPGNVRELENMVRRLAILTRSGRVGVGVLEGLEGGAAAMAVGEGELALPPPDASLAEMEAFWIRQMLARCGGNKTEAARRLGVDPSTIHRKLRDQD